MTALVINTENEMRKVAYDPPHYEVIQIGRASCRERV